MFLLQSDIFFWDLLILIIMTFSFCGGVGCIVWLKRHRQGLVQRLFMRGLCICSFIGFALVTYGSFIEPQLIVVTEKTVTSGMDEALNVAVISDLHIGPYKGKDFLERVVKRTNALLPDIVLLPGDFILTHDADLSELSALKDLRPTIGVYAVLGNHDVGEYETFTGQRYDGIDRGDRIEDTLTNLGVHVLRNASKKIELSSGDIAIAGVDDVWTGHASIVDALNGIKRSTYTILLSHNPSIIDDPQSLDANLIVSGHTHGGQIRLPGIGPLAHLPTSLGQDYDQGLFTIQPDTVLAISRGAGESSARSRLFAPPEILLLKLQ